MCIYIYIYTHTHINVINTILTTIISFTELLKARPDVDLLFFFTFLTVIMRVIFLPPLFLLSLMPPINITSDLSFSEGSVI